MSIPSIEGLKNDPQFVRAEVIDHDNLMPFVQAYFLRLNPVMVIFALINLASLAAWIFFARQVQDGSGMLFTFILALVGVLPLIPLHEWIHGLVYRLQGARDVRYGGSLRKFYFYAIAHRFVVSAGQLVVLALAPLVVISLLCILLAWLTPLLRSFALALLFVHATAASGDFAILSYLWEQRGKTVYTFDDAETRQSYFYIRNER
jgi:hypothetical protein